MRNINLRYVDETYAPDGQLETFSVHYPDNFNFGYDVVDDIAVNDPDRRATPKARSISSRSPI